MILPVSATQQLALQVALVVDKATGACAATFAAPYWLLNLTGKRVRCRQQGDTDSGPSMRTLEPGQQSPVLFSYLQIGMKPSTRARFAVEDSAWSEGMNLNTVGYSGAVTVANSAGQLFSTSMRISMTTGGLSRMIILEPRFFVENRTGRELVVMEAGEPTTAVSLKPGSSQPFWPCHDPPLATVK